MCAVLCLVTQSSQLFVTPWTVASPPGSSVHGILQARILEGVVISFSRGIFSNQGSNPHLYVSCTGRQVLYPLHLLGSPLFFILYTYSRNILFVPADYLKQSKDEKEERMRGKWRHACQPTVRAEVPPTTLPFRTRRAQTTGFVTTQVWWVLSECQLEWGKPHI